MSTPATLSVLLDGLIDYAGLFPPANLDMQPMVDTYRRVMLDPRGWMVGRVIVPVSRLEEFELAAQALLPDEEEADPWCISALASPCGSDGLAADLDAIARFNARHSEAGGGSAVIDVVELKGTEAKLIDQALDMLPDTLFPFVEIPLDDDPRGLIAVLAGSEAAAKIRTGGVTPELYPSNSALAAFLSASAAAGVPFKATAGLHHPLPNDNAAVPARQQGFLNVFVAAAMALHHELAPETIEGLLESADVGSFDFAEAAVRFGTHTISLEELEEARLGFAISFGCCSIDEPWEDLQALGLLGEESREHVS
jgi:hypothetical protein